jgi:hypothetical protein
VITTNPNVLNAYYLSKAGILQGASGSGSTTTSAASIAAQHTHAAPPAPWNTTSAAKAAPVLAAKVLEGQSFISTNSAQLDVQGASGDYQSLFSVYQGLTALEGLTEQMLAKGATTTGNARIAATFNKGVGQVSTYVDSLKLSHLRLSTGTVSTKDASSIAPPTEKDIYTTAAIYSGDPSAEVPAFQGNVQFSINVKKFNGTTANVAIDLSQLGTTPRTIGNVVNYINSQLKAADVLTRFASNPLPNPPQTVKVGTKTITLPAGPPQYALKITTDSSETVSFAALSTAPAVYVTQTAGNPSGATGVAAPVQQLLKFQATDPSNPSPPPAASVRPGTANSVAGEVFNSTLASTVASAKATATAPDGSVYVLANVTGTTAGQTIQGTQDVALQKYDSTGNLIYTRTLGAANAATGYTLAVSSTGQVAIAGQVNGALDPNTPGNAAGADSFVTVYDNQGQELWTQAHGGLGVSQANAVAFGADGSVYVAGQTSGALPGATPEGGQDGYLQGFSSTGKPQFTTQFGTAGTDTATSLAVDGSTVIVGGVESGHGVVRNFALQPSGAPTLTATRDLGDLNGGAISGVAVNAGQVVVAGNTANPALNVGTVTTPASGGQDAFVATLGVSLAAAPTDAVSYFGGSGNDTVTGLAVANGQAYITGSSSGGLPGQPALPNLGAKEGFVTGIDLSSGAVTWSQTFKGQDGYAAPESIAVSATGASVLDRLGLPNGTIQTTGSQLLTAATSVRAGDQFQIRTSQGGSPATVTIDAADTPQTLTTKIQRAAGFNVKVAVTPSGGKNVLTVTPVNNHSTVELLPGATGKDALDALGLNAGVVQTPSSLNAKNGTLNATTGIAKNTYGLNIAGDFNLTTPAGIKAAQSTLKGAIAKVQTAYNDLVNAGKPKAPAAHTGPPPAYLTSEIANYQAGLNRLTGGASASGSGAVSVASLFT